ncbi:hypothetical protein [Methylibium rhizosphaerae]|uniref:hypothetical protein n=1 Tax=Methylibium rhizosphaerae TaxID=2570323 RepID=UPI00112A56A5|nr:hypothetical protein [Methylibium rhizosphaerae]
MSLTHSPIAGAVLCGCVVAALMTACSRMGRVVVEDHDGQPCFGIENTVATRMGDPELWGLHIETQGDRGYETVWSFTMAKPVPFPPGRCLRYGQAPAEARMDSAPPPLQVGRLYSVGLGARVKDPSDQTLAYTAEFCVIRSAAGAPRVHEVRWDEKAGIWDRAACATPSAGSHS